MATAKWPPYSWRSTPDLQVLAYAGLGVFYLNVLPAWLHLPTQSLHVSFAAIAVTVVVFLGIPLDAWIPHQNPR